MDIKKRLEPIRKMVERGSREQSLTALIELEGLCKEKPRESFKLIDYLSKHDDKEVRTRLSICLIEHLIDENIETFSKWAKSNNSKQRETLAQSLALLKFEKAIKIIEALSKDKNSEVRLYSLMWFFYHPEDIRKERSQKVLNAAKKDKDENIVKLAEHLMSESKLNKVKGHIKAKKNQVKLNKKKRK